MEGKICIEKEIKQEKDIVVFFVVPLLVLFKTLNATGFKSIEKRNIL